MKLLFCYMVHRMNPVLEASVRILSRIGTIIVHVDARVPLSDFDPIAGNVIFTDRRIAVRWGGYPQIQADIELLKSAEKQGPFDYLFMMSGDCMPIRSNEEIVAFLEKNRGKEFICAMPNETWIERRVKYQYPAYYSNKNRHWLQSAFIVACDRIPGFHRNPFLRKNPSFKRLPPLYKGANWFTITGNCCRYIVEYLDTHPEYLKAFERSHCGDEIIFHTLVYNSLFRKNIYAGDAPAPITQLRYIDWQRGPDFPRKLDETDYPSMKRSGCLIARKIAPETDFAMFEKQFTTP